MGRRRALVALVMALCVLTLGWICENNDENGNESGGSSSFGPLLHLEYPNGTTLRTGGSFGDAYDDTKITLTTPDGSDADVTVSALSLEGVPAEEGITQSPPIDITSAFGTTFASGQTYSAPAGDIDGLRGGAWGQPRRYKITAQAGSKLDVMFVSRIKGPEAYLEFYLPGEHATDMQDEAVTEGNDWWDWNGLPLKDYRGWGASVVLYRTKTGAPRVSYLWVGVQRQGASEHTVDQDTELELSWPNLGSDVSNADDTFRIQEFGGFVGGAAFAGEERLSRRVTIPEGKQVKKVIIESTTPGSNRLTARPVSPGTYAEARLNITVQDRPW